MFMCIVFSKFNFCELQAPSLIAHAQIITWQQSIWRSQLTQLRETSKTVTSTRTVTFWPSATTARMKSGERRMLVSQSVCT